MKEKLREALIRGEIAAFLIHVPRREEEKDGDDERGEGEEEKGRGREERVGSFIVKICTTLANPPLSSENR